MALIILRCVFFAVAIALGFRLSTSTLLQGHSGFLTWLSFLGVLLLAAGVVFGDVAIRSKRLTTITAIYFGMFIGLVLTYVFQLALSPLLPQDNPEAIGMVQLGLAMIVCYSCISILLQTQGRLPVHHSLCRIREGSKGAQAVRARHQRRDRRPHCRHRRDARDRQPADHAAVRDRRTAKYC